MNSPISNSKSTVLRRKVYDPFQRFLHGMLAVCIVLLAATGLLASYVEPGSSRHQLWQWHIKVGFVLIVILIVRIVWGFVGPRFARFRDFFKFFATSKQNHFSPGFGHDPKAALLYLGVFGVLGLLVGTGLLLSAIEHNKGPLRAYFFDELQFKGEVLALHFYSTWFVLGFVGLHIGALLWHQHQTRLPMITAMFTGFQYRRKNEEAKLKK